MTSYHKDRIEHRAAKISFVTGLSTLLAVCFQLISVPICLKYWGKEAYGSWLTLYAAFMLIRSLDTGFISYVGNKINYLYHQDQNALREHLASSIAVIALIGALQVSLCVAAFFFKSVGSFLGVSGGPVSHYQSGLALMLLVSTWALSGSYLGIVHRLMIPTGMMYQAAWWSMGFQICQFIGIILAAVFGFNVFQASILFAGIQFLIYMASAVYIRRKLPAYYPWWRGGRLRIGMEDLGHSMMLTARNLIMQGSTNGTVMLLAALSGPAAVPVFTTVRTMANLWTNVTSVLTTPLLPEIVRFHATFEGRKLLFINEAYWVLVGSVVNLGVLITYPLIERLYGYWTTHAVALDKPLLCLLLSSVVVSNAVGLIELYLNGINSLGTLLVTSACRGMLSVVVGGILFLHFGLAGLGLGILGGELLALLVMGHYFVRYELPRLGISVAARSLLPIAISSSATLVFLLCEGFGRSLAPQMYIGALLCVAAAGVWGWEGLAPDVKFRLRRMCAGRLLGSDAV